MKNYETISSAFIGGGPKLKIYEDTVRLPNGAICRREKVVHPGAVVILPVTAPGRFVLIRQYRHAIAGELLEFPAGTLEAGEAPEACAKREIMEEIGFAAASWTPLGVLYPAPGFCDELQHLFLARDLTSSKLPGDEDEIIEVAEMSSPEIVQAICSGELRDAKSISIFARARFLGLI